MHNDYLPRGIHGKSVSGLTTIGDNSPESGSITALAHNQSVAALEVIIAELKARISTLESQIAAKA
jgi:hypothetical protein